MAIFEETVPKWVYDQKCAEYADLLAKYHALRPTHAPVTPMKLVPPTGSDESAVQRMGAALADERLHGIAAKLLQERPDLSMAAALSEAKRLDDIARGKAVPT